MKSKETSDLQEELDYLGLKLNKLPKFIKESTIPAFNISRLNNDKDLKIYKSVPIDKIEILLTPTLRSDSIKKKYSEAVPLKNFLNDDGDEEEMMLYKTFARILRNMSLSEIEKVENMQNAFREEKPFKVRYNRDHLWQIYYSEKDEKYFMFVCTKEDTFSEFIYLLKSQIAFSKTKSKNAPMIYVPINYVNYSEKILQKSEISDIENYLWLFTKNWPLIFEVYDENNNVSLQIVGETFVYKNIKSFYKMTLISTEEGIKFYKLMKALFILQTEIKGQYKFETKVNSNNELSMYLSKVEITFDSLTDFIKNEFLLADYQIKEQNEETIMLEKQLLEMKEEVKVKEEEYLQKQKEISTYLECKKTFFGKVKYFFKSDKKVSMKKKNTQKYDDIKEVENKVIDTKPIKSLVENQDYYTIEDLVTIYSLHEKGAKHYKNLKQDIKALELKLQNLDSKVKNANLYINEIDKHKKSIFEFWKFANKDEKLALEMADENDKHKELKEIRKVFNFDMDFESLGEEFDRIQRKKLSNEELDSIYIAQTELLELLNDVRQNKITKEELEVSLEKLKEQFNKEKLIIDTESFDIFGNFSQMTGKVKYIGSRSHRELEKNKFKIMNINKQIDIFDFTERINSILNYLEGAIPKITSKYDIDLYKVFPIYKGINEKNFDLFNISVENELENFDGDENVAYNLVCLNFKEGMPLLYYTNSAFFDNSNKTLPIGMNLSTKVLVDCNKFDFLLVNKTKFRTNSYFKKDELEGKPNSKDVFVYEYDVTLKGDKSKPKEEKQVLIEDIQEPINLDTNDIEENLNKESFINDNKDNLDVKIFRDDELEKRYSSKENDSKAVEYGELDDLEINKDDFSKGLEEKKEEELEEELYKFKF